MRDIKGVLIDLDGVVHGQFVWWGEEGGEDGEGSGTWCFWRRMRLPALAFRNDRRVSVVRRGCKMLSIYSTW